MIFKNTDVFTPVNADICDSLGLVKQKAEIGLR